jgi:hypothetical protein
MFLSLTSGLILPSVPFGRHWEKETQFSAESPEGDSAEKEKKEKDKL